MKRRMIIGLSLSLGVLAVAVAYTLGRARASGIPPAANAFVYTGTLLDNGAPLNGTENLQLTVFQTGGSIGSPVCTQFASQPVTVTNGRFSVALDSTCVAAVHTYPSLSIDIQVNGSDLGSSPLTAVPYAVEADTATNLPNAAGTIASLAPPGTIIAYGGVVTGNTSGTKPPAGWLFCNGDPVSETTYAGLFAAIGTAYGAPGGGNFSLPDLRGYFLRGTDLGATRDPDSASRTADNPGGNVGANVGSFEADEYAQHNHGVTDPGHVHGITDPGHGHSFANNVAAFTHDAAGANQLGGTGFVMSTSFIQSATTGITIKSATTGISIKNNGGSETRPKNVNVNYLIKY